MIPFPSGVRVWLAAGRTDMRRGMNGLALQVQEILKRDPYGGHLFVFRGRRGDLIKGKRALVGVADREGRNQSGSVPARGPGRERWP
jgi:transposase